MAQHSRVNHLETQWNCRTPEDCLPLPEYPRPQLMRREDTWQNLNGWWDYAILPRGAHSGKEAKRHHTRVKFQGKILVPYSPESERSGVGRTLHPGEDLWYEREFYCPESPGQDGTAGRRLLLHFGAVDERCCVWVNGRRAGIHHGGYWSFTLDITPFVRRGSNTVRVCVRDDSDQSPASVGKQHLVPGGMYYTAQSGIWQTVWLERVPQNYIRDIRMVPAKNGSFSLSVYTQAKETGSKKPVTARIYAPGIYTSREIPGQEKGSSCLCSVQLNSYGTYHHGNIRVPADWRRFWTPEEPWLYPVTITAGEDTIRTYTALRTVGTARDSGGVPRITLNGKPCFMNGVLDQGYWPESLMTPPSDEAMVSDIRLAQSAGFNMIRKHVKLEGARWYYHCDRMGMLVWQDMVNAGSIPYWFDTLLPNVLPPFGMLHIDHARWLEQKKSNLWTKDQDTYRGNLRSTVKQLQNSPCVVLWTIFNEGWGQHHTRELTQMVRRMDPTRLIDSASGWFDHGTGDVYSIHNYWRPLIPMQDPSGLGRPYVLSEYGGRACRIPGHTLYDETFGYYSCRPEKMPELFRRFQARIARLARRGLAAAVYTQLSDIEEEINGIATYDRKVVKVR